MAYAYIFACVPPFCFLLQFFLFLFQFNPPSLIHVSFESKLHHRGRMHLSEGRRLLMAWILSFLPVIIYYNIVYIPI